MLAALKKELVKHRQFNAVRGQIGTAPRDNRIAG
jgi:hypothetical protein